MTWMAVHVAWQMILVAFVFAMPWLTGGCERRREAPVAAAPRDAEAQKPVKATPNGGLVSVPPDSPHAKQIKVEAVQARELAIDEVVAPARVAIDPNRTSKVLLPVAGRIVTVRVRLGDTVEQGQPVLMLESPDADGAIAAHLQAEAAQRQADAALAKAESDFQRTKDLYEIGAVPRKDFISTQNDLAQARAALEIARAALGQSRRKLELLGLRPGDLKQLIAVRAPISGKVLEISVAPGEYRNDTGTPLMTIADLARVWVSSDVPEPFIRLIRIGDPVAITLIAFPGEIFTGRVARIADVLDPQSRTIKVHVEIANPGGRFRSEMYGSIRHAGTTRSVPVLPLTALVQEYGRSIVFVERSPGSFERREVTTGARVGDVVPVLQGVRAGERVIVDGGVLLKDQ